MDCPLDIPLVSICAQLAASQRCTPVCRVAIPIEKFYKKAEQDIEDWYELGKNDFASDIGTVSLVVPLRFCCRLPPLCVSAPVECL